MGVATVLNKLIALQGALVRRVEFTSASGPAARPREQRRALRRWHATIARKAAG